MSIFEHDPVKFPPDHTGIHLHAKACKIMGFDLKLGECKMFVLAQADQLIEVAAAAIVDDEIREKIGLGSTEEISRFINFLDAV